jgi:hypothetical protein
MAEENKETTTIFCNWCKQHTTHILRARNHRPRLVREGEVEEGGQPADIITSIWSCAGCDSSTFETRMIMIDDGDAGPIYYPPRSNSIFEESLDRIEPKQFRQLKPELTELYREVALAFNGDCLLLCTIGLRALLEGACKDKKVQGKNLEQRINNLYELVPNLKIIDALHAIRFEGNDAAHDLKPLAKNDARLFIEFIEDVLKFFYELDDKANRVTSTSPKATKEAKAPFLSAQPKSIQ